MNSNFLVSFKKGYTYIRKEKGNIFSARFPNEINSEMIVINNITREIIDLISAARNIHINDLVGNLHGKYSSIPIERIENDLLSILKYLLLYDAVEINDVIREGNMIDKFTRLNEYDIRVIKSEIESNKKKYISPLLNGLYDELWIRSRLFNDSEQFWLNHKNSQTALVGVNTPPDMIIDNIPNMAILQMAVYTDIDILIETIYRLADMLNDKRKNPLYKFRIILRSDQLGDDIMDRLEGVGFQQECKLLREYGNNDMFYYSKVWQ